MKLGLRPGTVRLVKHSKGWKGHFENEKKRLIKKFRGQVIDVEHIGSTAIPGIPAKPIIDIAVGIQRMKDAHRLVRPLAELGYHLQKKFGHPKRQLMFIRGTGIRHTHFLYVMKYQGAFWRKLLFFRDYLRTHPIVARRYIVLKKSLARQYANERRTYTKSKKPFVASVLKRTIG